MHSQHKGRLQALCSRAAGTEHGRHIAAEIEQQDTFEIEFDCQDAVNVLQSTLVTNIQHNKTLQPPCIALHCTAGQLNAS